MNKIIHLISVYLIFLEQGEGVIRTSDKSDLQRKSLSGLDCRNPSSVSTGLLAQICDQKVKNEEGEMEDVVLLYSSRSTLCPLSSVRSAPLP